MSDVRLRNCTDDEPNDVPMIPKHQHQAEIMHMSRAVKAITLVSLSAFIAIVIMAYIFVSGYTSRTKDWLNTYNNLQHMVEVTDGQKEP